MIRIHWEPHKIPCAVICYMVNIYIDNVIFIYYTYTKSYLQIILSYVFITISKQPDKIIFSFFTMFLNYQLRFYSFQLRGTWKLIFAVQGGHFLSSCPKIVLGKYIISELTLVGEKADYGRAVFLLFLSLVRFNFGW